MLNDNQKIRNFPHRSFCRTLFCQQLPRLSHWHFQPADSRRWTQRGSKRSKPGNRYEPRNTLNTRIANLFRVNGPGTDRAYFFRVFCVFRGAPISEYRIKELCALVGLSPHHLSFSPFENGNHFSSEKGGAKSSSVE